jgi:hypothetical protein
LIFYAFSGLFFIFGIVIFFKTVNPACGLYFIDCSLIKNWINLLCVLFSTGAFAVGYLIHPEKEAIKYLVKKVERELHAPARRIQIEFNAIVADLSRNLSV